jgi:hypothetical protein
MTLITVAIVIGAYVAQQKGWFAPQGKSPVSTGSGSAQPLPSTSPAPPADGGAEIARLYREKRSDTWVEGSAKVAKLLPDDRDGDQHQKWLAEIAGTSLTVRFVHNIDVAPRVPVEKGDAFRFRGEYEWGEEGGTIHFTHRPKFRRRDPGGWIDFEGKRYE